MMNTEILREYVGQVQDRAVTIVNGAKRGIQATRRMFVSILP